MNCNIIAVIPQERKTGSLKWLMAGKDPFPKSNPFFLFSFLSWKGSWRLYGSPVAVTPSSSSSSSPSSPPDPETSSSESDIAFSEIRKINK